jgi:hypothetical protein
LALGRGSTLRHAPNSRPLCIVQLVFRVEGILILAHQPERTVELGLAPVSLQQAFGFEPFEVGQVAQGVVVQTF